MSIESCMIFISRLRVCGLIPPAAYELLFTGLEHYRIAQGKNHEIKKY